MSVWDSYAEELAALGRWDPAGVLARDAFAMARERPAGPGAALQGMAMLRDVWGAIPADFRGELQGKLVDALSNVSSQVAGDVADVPVVQIAATIIAGIQRIAGAVSGTNAIKRAASNYAHGDAQYRTAQQLVSPSDQVFKVVPIFEYAQFVKIRTGGDFDRKPGFTRWGGARDGIFTGRSTPGASGNCRKAMRRGSGDSYGPFSPSCGAQLGLSALFWPWWSPLYSPAYLPQWEGSPAGAQFQAGKSPDTNKLLVGMQAGLLTDPAVNAKASLAKVDRVVNRFLSWYDGHAKMRPLAQDGANLLATGSPAKGVDASMKAGHVLSESASSYWYRTPEGLVVPYDGQPGADLDRWGVELPSGKPGRLAVSLTMRNAVVAARASFAQRRLATLRSPRMVEGLVADHGGLTAFDKGARAAMEVAIKSRDDVLPYPGDAGVKRAVARRTSIPRSGSGGGAAVAALLFLWGAR